LIDERATVAQRRVYLPNILSVLRVFLIPVIILLLSFEDPDCHIAAAIVFAFAAFTDMADGLIARRYNSVTSLGKLLDPLADKLLVSSILIMLVSLGRAPGWMVAVIVGREILVTGLRGIYLKQGRVIAAMRSGKFKAVVQYLAIFSLCLGDRTYGISLGSLGLILLWIALILTVYSGTVLLWECFKKDIP